MADEDGSEESSTNKSIEQASRGIAQGLDQAANAIPEGDEASDAVRAGLATTADAAAAVSQAARAAQGVAAAAEGIAHGDAAQVAAGLGGAIGGAAGTLGAVGAGISGLVPEGQGRQVMADMAAAANTVGGVASGLGRMVGAVAGVVEQLTDHDDVCYAFESSAFDGVQWRVETLHLSERLGRPYVAQLTVSQEDGDADVTRLLGQTASLQLSRGALHRHVHGVVRSVVEGTLTGGDRVATQLELVPALALMALRRDSRVFQDMPAAAIIAAVLRAPLSERNRELNLDALRGSYAPREFCVQYQETDLDFVHRLMDEEGITYSFTHEEDGHEVLVLRDHNAQAIDAPSRQGGGRVVLEPHNLEVSGREPVHRFRRTHQPVHDLVTVTWWDWTQPSPFSHDEPSSQQGGYPSYEHGLGRRVQLSRYDEGVGRYQHADDHSQALQRHQACAVEALVGEGVGRAVGFTAGSKFSLSGHPTPGLDGEYLITQVEHRKAAVELADTHGHNEPYHNVFRCIPIERAFRPQRRALKPSIASIQTAVVVGPNPEEIHTDQHGRVKVQLHWDRLGEADDHSSCWVRCQQVWAGAGWGTLFLPRVGMEVLVSFVDGDPDRPLITGCAYNGDNRPPYPLPEHKTRSTIKTRSSPGGEEAGFNELRFEDKAGHEEIYLHAQKDLNEVVLSCHSTTVHVDQSNTVGRDQSNTIGRNQSNTVEGDQDEAITWDQRLVVGLDRDKKIHGNENIVIGGNRTESVSGHEEVTIHGEPGRKVSVRKNDSLTVHGKRDVYVKKDDVLTIKKNRALTIVEKDNCDVGIDRTLHVARHFNTSVGEVYKVHQGADDKLLMHGRGWWHSATKIEIECGKACALKLEPNKATLGVGPASITVEPEKIKLVVGGSTLELTPDGIEGHGAEIEWNP